MARSFDCELPIDFMGFDFVVYVAYRMTYAGCTAQTYGPPENCYPEEPAELEIDRLTLYRDEPGALGFEATGALFQTLCEVLDDAVYQDLCERGGDEPDYDNYRDWEDA